VLPFGIIKNNNNINNSSQMSWLIIIIIIICQALECGLVRGAFGEVRLAFVKGSCEKVAVKVIEKKGFTDTTAINNVSCWRLLR